MAQNKLEDLRNHAFAALERLNDEALSAEQLDLEVSRAKAIQGLIGSVVDTAKVEIDFLDKLGMDYTNSQLFKSSVEFKKLD